jgi:hypothetical protein
VIGAALVIVKTGIFGFKFSWVSPGWEVYDQMGGMRIVTEDGAHLYTDASGFNPKENDVTPTYWKVDVDNETYGIPTVMVEVSDVRHTDFGGNTLEWDQYVQTRNVTRGNYTYYLDYHIYIFTVVLRTEADKTQIPGSLFFAPEVFHETSWPYIGQHPWIEGGGHISDPPYFGKEFVGAAYVKFIIDPWRGETYHTPPNSSFVLSDCWAGIMNAHVLDKTQGTVTNQWGTIPTPEADAQFFVKGGLDQGFQVPMFADDGTFGSPSPPVDWGGASPDERIASAVVLQLPIEMSAGADVYYDGSGHAADIYPVDVAVSYTVRIDVLQSHGFVLQGGNPPDPTWPKDYFGWSEDFWTSLLNGLNPFGFLGAFSPLAWFIVTLIAIGFILLIVLAVFAPWVLPRIFGGLRQTRDFAYESIEKRPRRRHSAV